MGDNNASPTLLRGHQFREPVFCVLFRRGNMSAWIDLLIVIPSWLGVFGLMAAVLAEVVG